VQVILLIAGVFALAGLFLWEVGLAFPAPWWLYLMVALVFVPALIRPGSWRKQMDRWAILAAVVIGLAVLCLVDWNTRKPFLRDLAKVRTGMTEQQVRQIMGRYLEGTGWPAGSGSGTLSTVLSPWQYEIDSSSPGEMKIRDALVFRHSTDGAFDSDWGIISFSHGRVIRVEFSAD
jgi:hypothetical protein